jgi:glycosyltransferase involved in cell wall biosynthesis
MSPLVTVLTAVRNGERFLPNAIASIRSQTFDDWEYVIVDDASDDGTVRVVEAAMEHDPRINLIRRSVGGSPYVAANEGLRHAQGKYVIRLDADVVAVPTRIASQLAFLEAHPSLRACAGLSELVSPAGLRSRRSQPLPRTPGTVSWHLVVRRNFPHSSACIERSVFEEIGGYRELPAAQDLRLWCDLSRRRWVGVLHEVVVQWRMHADRLSMRMRPVQQELAIDVLRDHVEALTAELWSREDLSVLWGLQRRSASPIRHGMTVLRRWERAWKADGSLGPDERSYLTDLKRKMLLRLILLRRPLAPRPPSGDPA